MHAVLVHLQTYLQGAARPRKARASLILVGQVLLTLAECVGTFSEPEDALGIAEDEESMVVLDRMRWALKETKILDVQGRL